MQLIWSERSFLGELSNWRMFRYVNGYDIRKDIVSYMKQAIATILIVLCLALQTQAQNVAVHEAPSTVISAMLSEPYLVALLSMLLLFAALLWFIPINFIYHSIKIYGIEVSLFLKEKRSVWGFNNLDCWWVVEVGDRLAWRIRLNKLLYSRRISEDEEIW